MPYKFKESKNGQVSANALAEFESFWLYHDFNVDGATGVVRVNRGYVAVHFSQGPDKRPSITKPSFGANLQSFVIEDEGGNQIGLTDVRLVESRRMETSNEFSQVHLFEFANNARSKWISEGSWNRANAAPVLNRDRTTFIDHVGSVGGVPRYAFAVIDREVGDGLSHVSFVRAYLRDSLFSTILAHNGGPAQMPALQVTSRAGTQVWNYFNQYPLQGMVTGYVSVVNGAFKNITLGEIEQWDLTGVGSHEGVMNRLAELVYRPPQWGTKPLSGREAPGLIRTLDTIDETSANGVMPATPRVPLEIACFRGLNGAGGPTPVPPII